MSRIISALIFTFLLSPGFSQLTRFSIYLVGDAGKLPVQENGLKELLQNQFIPGVPSAFVFLGDNIYPKGMPPVGDKNRDGAENIIRSQIDLVKDFHSRVYFIPGNHDWQTGNPNGWKYIQHQQQFLDSLHNPILSFQPKDGCPGPVEIHLDEELVLAIIDSQWFLHRGEKPVGEESSCDVKKPEDAAVRLNDLLQRNRGKRVILAAHHPVYTYGAHGGVFTWKQHLFPLTDIHPSIFLPLPIIGSLYPLYRTNIGSIQDTAHPVNRRYRKMISALMTKYPETLFASGHEHALEHMVKDSAHYVVSGSGAKTSIVKKKGFASYVSPSLGFSRIDILADKKARISFFEVGRTGATYQYDVPAMKPKD